MQFSRSKTAVCALLVCATSGMTTIAADIEPPRVQLVDKFGVNLANGQVTHSMGIVSIGGAMGLSDSISVFANEFAYTGYRGLSHRYSARASDVQLVTTSTMSLSPRNAMRVYGPSGSADFAYMVGGVIQDYGTATTGYTYAPLGDARNSLEAIGNDLVWTTSDGTELRFDRGGPSPKPASQGGLLTSIKYPNGFAITITAGGMSVNTNTGFQLKRLYESDPASCSASPPVRTSDESGWTLHNPKFVVGINAAYEHCPPNATSCPLTKDWPKARFDWPSCMPDILYRGNTQATVTNAQGVSTTYKFNAFDLAYAEGGILVPGFTPGAQFSPRLVSVSRPNNPNVPLFSYAYKNIFVTVDGDGFGAWDHRLGTAGFITGAQRETDGASYDALRPYYYDSESVGAQNAGVSFVRVLGNLPGAVGAIDYAVTDDGRIDFEHTPRNFPTQFQKHSAPNESYGYDARGNLTSIDFSGAPSRSVVAQYPASCTPATRKICNQATRIRDANGNWTDYEYFPEHGQVKSVKSPPNKRGISAQTRYTYTELSATYFNANGVLTQGSPIWMKRTEKFCINSETVEGSCAGNDEVVTTYRYEPKNLLLNSVTVEGPDGLRRTCYQYDVYGNQVGVTTPNASLGSCPGDSL